MKGPKPLTIVIKLGTSSIVDEKTHEPLLSILSLIVETAVKLRKDGHKVIIVSSGAIGVGLRRMDLEKRPKHLPRVQDSVDSSVCGTASSLITGNRLLKSSSQEMILPMTQYRNAQNTLAELLEMKVIPIVNENDTIAVSEIKFGDNDTLSAITAAMLHADYLFLMTDVDCLYDKNPRTYPDAQTIEVVEDIGALQADVSSAGSSLGTGGMGTKIVAARLATSAGVTTIITRSSNPGNIINIVNYMQALKASRPISLPGTPPQLVQGHQTVEDGLEEPLVRSTASLSVEKINKAPLHTRFIPSDQPIRDRYFWLLHGLAPHGIIYIDAGAQRALANKNGLLPAGVLDVEGNFAQQEAVRLVVVNRLPPGSRGSSNGKLWDGTPVEVGRALVNYSATQVARIKGVQSTEITGILGYADSEYVALRENISLYKRESRPVTPSLDIVPQSSSIFSSP